MFQENTEGNFQRAFTSCHFTPQPVASLGHKAFVALHYLKTQYSIGKIQIIDPNDTSTGTYKEIEQKQITTMRYNDITLVLNGQTVFFNDQSS
jgi:hypothetical protein